MTTGLTTLVVCSGGMDSTTLAYAHHQLGDLGGLVSINYGQRHLIEIQYASVVAQALGVPHTVVRVPGLSSVLPSALTDPTQDVPHGHYEDLSMAVTVVPNRNMILLSIAAGVALSQSHGHVATAVHAGDHAVYPDCRPDFIEAVRAAVWVGTDGAVDVTAPYVHKTKTDIARIGNRIGVPWATTWSCYEGGAVHCGRCGTCTERREALRDGGGIDPTDYQA